jgi:ABC-2 type transport system permease protein
MTGALIQITLRALLNRRRTVLLALIGALLVGIVVIFRLSSPPEDLALQVTLNLLGDLGIGVVLPIVAVIVGTSALGSELDDGTIVYLLAKPVARWRIVIVKLLVAWLVTVLLVAPAMTIAAIIGTGDASLAGGFVVATLVGALEYTAVFVALSLITSRALVIGLAYVIVWEGIVAGLFAGTRAVSVRQHAMAVAEAAGGPDAGGLGGIPLLEALVAATVITFAATFLAIRRLETVELRGETG